MLFKGSVQIVTVCIFTLLSLFCGILVAVPFPFLLGLVFCSFLSVASHRGVPENTDLSAKNTGQWCRGPTDTAFPSIATVNCYSLHPLLLLLSSPNPLLPSCQGNSLMKGLPDCINYGVVREGLNYSHTAKKNSIYSILWTRNYSTNGKTFHLAWIRSHNYEGAWSLFHNYKKKINSVFSISLPSAANGVKRERVSLNFCLAGKTAEWTEQTISLPFLPSNTDFYTLKKVNFWDSTKNQVLRTRACLSRISDPNISIPGPG